MGIDEVGIDKVGIDEVGRYRVWDCTPRDLPRPPHHCEAAKQSMLHD